MKPSGPLRRTGGLKRSAPLPRSVALSRAARLSPRSKAKEAAAATERVERELTFARDRYRCRLEGVPGAGRCFGRISFHHRRKASQGGPYTVANGATLCLGHNDRLESDADLAALGRRLGLVLRAGDVCSPLPPVL